MINSIDECRSFGMLRNSLRQDLVSWHGFSNPVAGAILNWFDPANEEYLEHVNDWQVLLCTGATFEPPQFLKELTSRNAFGTYTIFDLPPDQVGAIHQIAKLVYKWHGTPRKETNMDEVKQRLHQSLPVRLDTFEIDGIRDALACIAVPDLNVLPGRFGPGATYEGFNAYEKWARKGGIPDVPASLFRVNSRDDKSFRSFGYGVTKIAEVPKSIKCNRIVSSEPSMYMFAQLAVNDFLVKELHHHFPQHVSLDDQERHNQALYWNGACSIDLSDASDHVSIGLVQAVLPQLWPVLAKVRSSFSLFPDGEEVSLETFAPMGSGVCFSVMTTVILGILRYASRVSKEQHRQLPTWFHVYGDDIIVPVWMYDIVIDLLARAGLVVNRQKSCCTLYYRESCGREMLSNTDITPAYIRDPLHTVDASKIEQIAQHLDGRFFPSTARTIVELSDPVRGQRWNRALQRLEVCVRATSVRQKVSSLDGWDGLNRWFSIHSQGNTFDDKRPSGVAAEVWTRPAWRYKASQDYPYLSTWFATRRRAV